MVECQVNPLIHDYTSVFGRYRTRIGVEIPIKGFSGEIFRQYSLKNLPTHQISYMSAFFTDGWEGDGNVKEVALFPFYFVR